MWGRGELLERIPAYHLRTVANASPDQYEVGTLNHEGIAGTLGAIEYLESLAPSGATRRERIVSAFAEITSYERELALAALDTFERVPGVRVHGIASRDRLDERVATFAITVDGVAPRDVACACAARSINVWSGNYYALEPMTRLGLEASGGAVRVSLVHYNTLDELGRLEAALREISKANSRG
jgi:selenocysteine lyase/cysteine desulfurase